MTLDKPTSTKIFAAWALVPLVVFLFIYVSGLSAWATTGVSFEECSDRLEPVLRATSAMLHIVLALLLLLAFIACVTTLRKGWKPFSASVIIQVVAIYFFWKMALPSNFAFAWTESVFSCSASSIAPLKLALAFLGACLSLGLSGFFGVVGLIVTSAKYRSR